MIDRLLAGLVAAGPVGLRVAKGIVASPASPVEAIATELLTAQAGLDPVSAAIIATVEKLGPSPTSWTVAALEGAKAFGAKGAGQGPALGPFALDLGVAPLLRGLPVALAYGPDPAAVALVAGGQARLTHWADEVEAATVLYCLVAAQLLAQTSVAEALASAASRVQALFGPRADLGLIAALTNCLDSTYAESVEQAEAHPDYPPEVMGPLVGGLAACRFGLAGLPPPLAQQATALRPVAEQLLTIRQSGE